MKGRFLTAALMALLSGCAVLDKADQLFAQGEADAKALGARPASGSGVITVAKPYLGVAVEESKHGEPLPSRWEAPDALTLQLPTALTLPQLAARITRETGIPVRSDNRVIGGEGTTPPPGVDSSGMLGTTSQPMVTAPPVPGTMAPYFSGPLSRLLDQMAAQFDLAWRYSNGAIVLDRIQTRTFMVRANSVTNKLAANVTSTSHGTGGSGSQDVGINATLDIWTEIDAQLKAILPPKSNYAVSRTTGSITVTTTPRSMEEVALYLDGLNTMLAANVAVEVTAIHINVDETDDYALSLDALYKSGVTGVGLALNGLLPTLAQNVGTGSIAILQPAGGQGSSHFSGSKVFLNAVSSAGRLADSRTVSVVAQNNTPTPLQLTTSKDIIKSIQFNTLSQTGTSSVSTTPETIEYGYSFQVIPRVLGRGEVGLVITLTVSDLTALEEKSVGDSQVLQLATIDARKFKNEITLTSGQTLVVAGYDQMRSTRNDRGLGSSGFWLFGGGKKGQVQRTRLLLLVTPTILPPRGG